MTNISRTGTVTVTVLATRPTVLGLFFVEFRMSLRLVGGYSEFLIPQLRFQLWIQNLKFPPFHWVFQAVYYSAQFFYFKNLSRIRFYNKSKFLVINVDEAGPLKAYVRSDSARINALEFQIWPNICGYGTYQTL